MSKIVNAIILGAGSALAAKYASAIPVLAPKEPGGMDLRPPLATFGAVYGLGKVGLGPAMTLPKAAIATAAIHYAGGFVAGKLPAQLVFSGFDLREVAAKSAAAYAVLHFVLKGQAAS